MTLDATVATAALRCRDVAKMKRPGDGQAEAQRQFAEALETWIARLLPPEGRWAGP